MAYIIEPVLLIVYIIGIYWGYIYIIYYIHIYVGVSINAGTPIAGWFIKEKPYKNG